MEMETRLAQVQAKSIRSLHLGSTICLNPECKSIHPVLVVNEDYGYQLPGMTELGEFIDLLVAGYVHYKEKEERMQHEC